MGTNASALALGMLGVAAIMVVSTPVWRLIGLPLMVVVEQLGHSVATFLTLRWVSGIDLRLGGRRNAYGFTYPSRRDFRPTMVVFYLSGYAAPPVMGLLLARGVDRGWDPSVVILALFVAIAMLVVFHSNVFTLVVMLVTAAVLLLLYWQGERSSLRGVVVLLAWLFLFGGIRRSLHLLGDHPYADDETDAKALQRETGISAHFWVATFMVVAFASLVAGARWLLEAA